MQVILMIINWSLKGILWRKILLSFLRRLKYVNMIFLSLKINGKNIIVNGLLLVMMFQLKVDVKIAAKNKSLRLNVFVKRHHIVQRNV